MKNENPVKRKLRYFTLIEVLVALIVVALVSGIFALNIQNLWRQQAFLDDSNLILSQLRLAQDIMQIMETDVEVSFQEKDGTVISKIVPKSPPPMLAQTMANQSALVLSTIGPIQFEDINGNILEKEFALTFFSRGFVMNHGTLQFGPKNSKDPTTAIQFHGYPEPLSLQTIESINATPLDQDQLERITEITRQETVYDEVPELDGDEEPPINEDVNSKAK